MSEQDIAEDGPAMSVQGAPGRFDSVASGPDRPDAGPEELAPQPLAAGTFAIYPAPDGGLVLVTDVAGRGVERRAVPGTMLRMLGGGGIMGRLFGKIGG